MPERFIGTKEASLIADALDWHKMALLAESARAYLPAVLAEIASLRATLARDPERMTIRALLFGIATPNRDEVQSIGWALGVERDFHTLSAHELARQTYVSLVTGKRVAIGFYTSLTATIDAIKRGRVWEHVTLDALEAIRGIGPKVARMITAVLNPDARVFTVDLWHCRQLLWASGREYCVRTGARARSRTRSWRACGWSTRSAFSRTCPRGLCSGPPGVRRMAVSSVMRLCGATRGCWRVSRALVRL
jgi:hypothetical protein